MWFLVFVNHINCDLSQEYKVTPKIDAIMKWYKIMNNELVTYTLKGTSHDSIFQFSLYSTLAETFEV